MKARMQSLTTVLFSLFLSLLLCACSSTPQTQPKKSQPAKPLEQTIKLRKKNPENVNDTEGIIIEKRLLNVVLEKHAVKVNGVLLKDAKAFERLLKTADQPVITIATHKCFNNQKAADILSLAQQYTNVPIAFSSFGQYDDPQCN